MDKNGRCAQDDPAYHWVYHFNVCFDIEGKLQNMQTEIEAVTDEKVITKFMLKILRRG